MGNMLIEKVEQFLLELLRLPSVQLTKRSEILCFENCFTILHLKVGGYFLDFFFLTFLLILYSHCLMFE